MTHGSRLRVPGLTRVEGEGGLEIVVSDSWVTEAKLARAWGFLGLLSATLVMAGFFLTLRHADWQPGSPTGPGAPLNHAYQQAATVAWLGIVACQVGTAFAVRTDHASLRQVGVFSFDRWMYRGKRPNYLARLANRTWARHAGPSLAGTCGSR